LDAVKMKSQTEIFVGIPGKHLSTSRRGIKSLRFHASQQSIHIPHPSLLKRNTFTNSSSSTMQFRALAISFVALLLLPATQGLPATEATALSCQACEWWGGANACCSASCIAKRQGFHGGYCDDHQVCHCNY